MKTQTIRKNQNNHFNSNTKNQKVMKTKKYSLMKKATMALAMLFFISGVAFSQTIEERKGAVSTYSVAAGAPTDEFTWTIEAAVAPVVVPAPDGGGTGTIGDPFIINYAANLTSIQVTWDAGTADIASTAGEVTVQRRIGTCASLVQTLDLTFWSNPTAVIAPAETDRNVCSAELIGGNIIIDLTGAPDLGESGDPGFDLNYVVAVSDVTLSVTGPNGPVGAGLVTSDGATVTIPLPDALVNTGAVAQTYTITLSDIQDDFNAAAVAIAGEVFTITVNPIPTTGIISSTGTLTRR